MRMRIGVLLIGASSWLFLGTACAVLFDSGDNATTVSGGTGPTLAVTVLKPSTDRTVPQGTIIEIEWTASNTTGQGAILTILVENRDTLVRTILADNIQITGLGVPTKTRWDTTEFPPQQFNIIARLVSADRTREALAPGRIVVNAPPEFRFTAPTVDTTLAAGGTVKIEWSAGDSNNDGKLRLGLDVDEDHGSGNEIFLTEERDIPEEVTAESFDFTGTDASEAAVPIGTYNLFALVEDGQNGVETVEGLARLTVLDQDDSDQTVTLGIRKPAGDSEFLAGAPPLDIEFGLNDGSDLLIDLKIDADDNHANGNEITILSQRFERAGTQTDTFSWDGTDSAGNPVADGIYRLLVVAGSGADTPRSIAATGLVLRRSTFGVPSRQTWEFTGNNWALVAPSTSPSARQLHALAFDGARNVAVLFGGLTATGSSDETWEWTRTNWRRLEPAVHPPALTNHALAFDVAREISVLFGGLNGATPSDQTWEWDGEVWIQRPETGPAARFGHALAYDSGRNVVVLFGGADGVGGVNNETWEWDGNAWLQLAPTNSPSPRQGHALAFDTARNVTVLFGGADAGGTLNDETWEWDGNDWTQKTSISETPAARRGHALAFDAGRRTTLLFGGSNGAVADAQTWEWTGVEWKEFSPNTIPSAREGHALVYDGGTGRTTLFGGSSSIPLIALLEPATPRTVDAGQFVTLRWRDDDPSGDATLRLVIDDDRNPNESAETDGPEIEILAARSANEDGVQDSFSWQVPASLEPGTYFIFAYIDHDGAAPADQISVAPATLIIRDPANPTP